MFWTHIIDRFRDRALKVFVRLAIYIIIEKLTNMKDLGVIFDSELSFRDHIQLKKNKPYSILSLIKRNFIYMDKNTFINLYKSLVRPHREYANSLRSPYKKGDVEAIEGAKRATKLCMYVCMYVCIYLFAKTHMIKQ